MPYYEITGFKGISREGVTFLDPSESFQNLEDGFVYRQVLQSRKGFSQFATGGIGDYSNLISKGFKPAETAITGDNVGNTVNLAEQSFTLNNVPIRYSYLIIGVAAQSKEIIATYDGTDWVFTGHVNTAGTNTIDITTGAVTVTFSTVLTAGDPILCNYSQTADVTVTAAAAAQQSFTVNDGGTARSIIRDTVVVFASTDTKTVTITAAPSEEILAENVGNSAAAATQTFNVVYFPIAKSSFTLSLTDSVLEAKEIVGTYDGTAWGFTGNVNAAGTNTVNEALGTITVTFDVPLTGGDAMSLDYYNNDGASFTGNVDRTLNNTISWATGVIQVGFDTALTAAALTLTYQYYPSLRIMGIFEHIEPDNDRTLLVVDKDYMYKYNSTNNALEQVPFTSTSIITSFGITSNDEYVSGTTYPDKSFGERFVFTGSGMSDVYFYDGYGIKRFTITGDNADYVGYNNGSSTEVLSKAKHVFFYGERINFLVPTLDGTSHNQGILFSGIRDTGGNGDDFNTPGSGVILLDTQDFISGWAKVNDTIFMNLYKSCWKIEKSRDAFNPYIVSELSTEKGSEVGFSTVGFENKAEAVGKEGIIASDLREVLRVDTKIPYFTRNEIDGDSINLTYGGYDPENYAFLFAYRSNESDESSTTQERVLFHNYEERTYSVFKQRFSCFGYTEIGAELAWNQIDEQINSSWLRWDTTEDVWNRIGVESAVKKTLAGDDNGFVFQLNVDFDDFTAKIFGVSKAASAVLSVTEHAFSVGDTVRIQDVEGMEEINTFYAPDGGTVPPDNSTNKYFTVTATTANTITINEDSQLYTTYAKGGIVSKVIEFSATFNEFNPWRDQGMQCYLKEAEFQIDTNGGSLRIDLFDNSSDDPWRTDVLALPNSTIKNRQYVKISIENVADFHTIRMRQVSAANQVRVTSVRLLAEPAGITND